MNPLRRIGRPEVIAHRGASAHAPENTMPAFESAWRSGAQWIECDVQPTADSELVLLHDDEVDRTTDGTGLIRGLHRDQWEGLDAGSWRGPEFIGVRIPTLSELLAALPPDQHILLEIKGAFTPGQIGSLIDQLEASPANDRVFLESFEVLALAEVHARRPDRPLGLLVEEWPTNPVALCRELGAASFNPDARLLIDRPLAPVELQSEGLAIWPWTIDDPSDWRRLLEIGIDGIITNRPGELVSFLANSAALN